MTTTFQIVTSVSLQCRPIWDVLSPILDSSDANVTFGGSRDDTYDIATYVPVLDPLLAAVLYTLVLTPAAIEEAARQATLARIEQFISVHQNGSRHRHVAIVFLNSDTAFQGASRRCTIDAFVALQALLFDSPLIIDIPITILSEPDELLKSLKEHYYAVQRNINRPPDTTLMSTSLQAPSNSTLYLLEQIVAQGSDQLACQQNVNILSDFFPSLRALSAASRTVEMRRLIAEYLGERLAKHIESFWNEEKIHG
ncbi:Hypothetical protein PENO1_100980 [Penicillium occitanis (nom. inval.)]|nr:Hypothetical protein PENO1_100980 [Penicillium occitanis (nom. inval.)]PCH10327.1 hypothetical protein PENOC_002990 [Penicillium occitanis (nom. inval.)]